MRPDVDATTEILTAAGVPLKEASSDTLGVVCRIEAFRLEAALAALRAVGYQTLVDLFGTDTGEAVELTYHLRRLGDLAEVYLKAIVAYDCEAPSVWRVYPAALYPEREAAELLGVSFAGHPNPKRLLTTEEVEGHLLRKDVLLRTPEEVAL